MSSHHLILGLYYSYFPHLNDEELEQLYQERYKRILTLVYNEERVKLVFYYSGPLLNWLNKRHPEYIAVLNELINQKRVEVLGAPYYEPILPMLSISDSLGQIEKMTTFIRKNLKKRSRGVWLPGSMWDQKLVSNLCSSGYGYTFLEDSYWTSQGIKEPYDLFQTEDQGKSILLFPIHRNLSDKLLNMECDKVEAAYKRYIQHSSLSCLFYPGEKIGQDEYFPWFEKMLQCMEKYSSKVNNSLPGEFIKLQKENSEKVFLRNTQMDQYHYFYTHYYDEVKKKLSYPAAAHYKNFLNEHRPSNYLYGKSTYTSILINQIRGDKARKKLSREYLWKGQNLYSYWDNEKSFQNSRQSLAYCMEAEKLTREKGIFKSSIIKMDLNNDGSEEYIFQGNTYNCAVNSQNSTLFQLDYLPDCWNYLYNEKGQSSFHDLFLKNTKNEKEILQAALNQSFNGKPLELRSERDDKQIIFYRDNENSDIKGKDGKLAIHKKFLFKRNWLVLSYKMTNTSESKSQFHFATNLCLSFPQCSKEGVEMISQSSKSSLEKMIDDQYKECLVLSLLDKVNNTDIQLDFSEFMDLYVLQDKYENWDNLYHYSICPHLKFELYPQESKEFSITLRLAKHR